MSNSIFDLEFLHVAKRLNNTKRDFLLVNSLLGKHIPVQPHLVLSYFERLGELVGVMCEGERVLVIGFAETATAVGVAVAKQIPGSHYCHTTRELVDCNIKTIQFQEQHSHATNQTLCLTCDLTDFDRIVFVEDEITTGRTIVNFLNELAYTKGKFTIATLVSALSDTKIFEGFDVEICALHTISGNLPVPDIVPTPAVLFAESIFKPPIELKGGCDPRGGVDIIEYCQCCDNFAEEIMGLIEYQQKDVLIVGAEEFMYPALVLGVAMCNGAKNVVTHSTTRSPIATSTYPYPINSRFELCSLYDCNRQTYLYNISKYDCVIVLFDGKINATGMSQLAGALAHCGNENINFVRWIK